MDKGLIGFNDYNSGAIHVTNYGCAEFPLVRAFESIGFTYTKFNLSRRFPNLSFRDPDSIHFDAESTDEGANQVSFPQVPFSKHRYTKVLQTSSHQKFFFVRNPWDRLVSVYVKLLSMFEGIETSGRVKFHLNPMYYRFKRVRKAFFGTSAIDSSMFDFKSFVNLVLWHGNPHWGLQTEAAMHPIDRFSLIGRYESIQSDFDTIVDIVARFKNKRYVFLKIPDEPYDDYRDFYDDTTKDLIYLKYKEDIENFNYEF